MEGQHVTKAWSIMGERFDLDEKYKVVDYLGAGAYGVVCAARDQSTDTVVAVKKCRNIFQSRTLAKRTLREIRLLRLLNHDNVIKILSILQPVESIERYSNVYIIFSLMETDLASIIRSGQVLRDQHVQYFSLQILRALDYLHTARIVHRDLKPRNLLVNGDCHLKIADFGLARFYDTKTAAKCVSMTEYVTTRWYRAPEILVGWQLYGFAVDMWAVGCIIVELISRKPLFPGHDGINQVELICGLLGKPDEEYIAKSRKPVYKEHLKRLPAMRRINFQQAFLSASSGSVELIEGLLQFDPDQRMSASVALGHPYVHTLNSIALPKSGNESFPDEATVAREFAFEDMKISVEYLREEILSEAKVYHPDDWYPSKPLVTQEELDLRGAHEAAAVASSQLLLPSDQTQSKTQQQLQSPPKLPQSQSQSHSLSQLMANVKSPNPNTFGLEEKMDVDSQGDEGSSLGVNAIRVLSSDSGTGKAPQAESKESSHHYHRLGFICHSDDAAPGMHQHQHHNQHQLGSQHHRKAGSPCSIV